jgi:hypothetical protein
MRARASTLRGRTVRMGAAAAVLAVTLAPALSATFDFVPAPQTDLNRIYRIDRFTGEVTSCQYGLQEGTVGVTLCFGAGDGAGPQTPGEYGLVASRHEREGGVFRVNYRTGEMSVCYVFDEKVVCTPQTGPKAVTPAAAAPSPPAAAPSPPAAQTMPAPGLRTPPSSGAISGQRP